MKIDRAVKYLGYKKLKLRILTSLMGIFIDIEKFLEKPLFSQKPYLVPFIYSCFLTLVFLIIYCTILFISPQIFTIDVLLLYIVTICFLVFYFSLIQFKSDFFEYLKHDHFFNLLNGKQSEYINKTINFNVKYIILTYLVPFLIPSLIHIIIFNKLYFMIILLPQIVLAFYFLLKYFIVLYLNIHSLAKQDFFYKIIYYFIN